MSCRLLAVLLLATLPRVTGAQAASPAARSDSAATVSAVVAVAKGLLTAISTRDTTLARRLLLPGAQLASIPDPASPTAVGRMQSDNEFVATLATAKPVYLERLWNPTVFVHGSLAVVRAPYDFFLDGKFSHCGVDVFTLLRSRGEWRITHVVYTTQRQGCAPSPLGAPQQQ